MYENDLYSNGESYRSDSYEDRASKSEQEETGKQPGNIQEEEPRMSGNMREEQNRYFDHVEENRQNRSSDIWAGPNPNPAPVQPPKKERKRGSGFLKKAVCAVVLAVIFGSVAGGTFYGICRFTGVLEKQEVQAPPVYQNPNPYAGGERVEQDAGVKNVATDNVQVLVGNDYSQVVEEVIPAMVTILNTYIEREQTFWGQYYTQEKQGGGTGIIIGENDTELLVATNYHVVADTVKLELTFVDGETVEGRIKGQDSEMDLAVVAIALNDLKPETRNAIAIATLGESEKLKLGEPALVIGNALGIGISVTDGIISGLNREMTMEDGRTGTFIQTNAAVNHGNSGGALLNVKGEVIGIVSNKIDGISVEGMGYAIPIDSASGIISELKEHKTRVEKVSEEERGYMGVTLQTVSSEAVIYYNMPSGAFIYEVTDSSAAKDAGLMKGDVITKVDGERVSSSEQVINIMQYYKVGEKVRLTVSRQENGEYVAHDYEITLREKGE